MKKIFYFLYTFTWLLSQFCCTLFTWVLFTSHTMDSTTTTNFQYRSLTAVAAAATISYMRLLFEHCINDDDVFCGEWNSPSTSRPQIFFLHDPNSTQYYQKRCIHVSLESVHISRVCVCMVQMCRYIIIHYIYNNTINLSTLLSFRPPLYLVSSFPQRVHVPMFLTDVPHRCPSPMFLNPLLK